jgi:hypothetical protein
MIMSKKKFIILNELTAKKELIFWTVIAEIHLDNHILYEVRK